MQSGPEEFRKYVVSIFAASQVSGHHPTVCKLHHSVAMLFRNKEPNGFRPGGSDASAVQLVLAQEVFPGVGRFLRFLDNPDAGKTLCKCGVLSLVLTDIVIVLGTGTGEPSTSATLKLCCWLVAE